MGMRWWLVVALGLQACSPQGVGEQVGSSLYKASVDTGQAIAAVGDRTGRALQDAGGSLRGGSAAAPPVTPPPFYAPPGYSEQPYAPPAPVTQERLGY